MFAKAAWGCLCVRARERGKVCVYVCMCVRERKCVWVSVCIKLLLVSQFSSPKGKQKSFFFAKQKNRTTKKLAKTQDGDCRDWRERRKKEKGFISAKSWRFVLVIMAPESEGLIISKLIIKGIIHIYISIKLTFFTMTQALWRLMINWR